MLLCLRVKNFAIIDELEVELGSGMNVLTGETGAGKSILVSALSLVLGAKTRPEVVRSGAESAEVEALFDVQDDPELQARLSEAGVEAGDELVLRRVIQKNGRSRAYVNGRLASAAELSALAAGLADISSQHEHHTLVDPRCHLRYLDAFGQLETLVAQVAEAHSSYAAANDALAELEAQLRDRGQREDLLRFQLAEIDAVAPDPGEEDKLRVERERQRHGQRLQSVSGEAEDTLYARDGSVCEELAGLIRNLEQVATLDPALAGPLEQLQAAHVQLEDAARELGGYARAVSIDAERLAELEERLESLGKLKRKYGGTLEAVLEHRGRVATELAALDDSEARHAQLEAARDSAASAAESLATKLSQKRKKVAGKLAERVSEELASLSMGDAKVEVEVEPAEPGSGGLSVGGARLTATGIDRVEFLIATNRGEQPQPLQRVASGGELSRAMLAIKRTLAGLGPGGLYVFDEVDAGVGGAVAEVIGRKIREVSRHHQVVCITHLAQIAVFANQHFRVRKEVVEDRTLSRIVPLSASEKKEEIARMLGGVEITDKTRAAAGEMLRTAAR
jgi:DNA repair protein RecN (Recombination protein N)